MTAIASIQIGDRVRKEMGDLQALAASIKAQGLLQPIGINPEGVLVFGERRLRACRDVLGWSDIEARTVDVTSLIEGERDENEVRKDFTVSERVAIARAIEAAISERRGRPSENPPNSAELIAPVATPAPGRGQETREFAAKKAGFGGHDTYRKAEAVIRAAAPELVAALDRGDVTVNRAHSLLDKPEPIQRQVAKAPKAEQARMMRGMKYDAAAEPWHIRVQTLSMALQQLAKAPLTAAEFKAHALPYTLQKAREVLPVVRALLDEIGESEHDQARSHQAA